MTTPLRTDGPIHGRVPRTETAGPPRPTSRLTPVPRENDRDWMTRSVCANASDPNDWFPAGTTGIWVAHIEETKARCLDCSVIVQCGRLLKHLEAHGPVAGIWSGTSEEDRDGERRREKRQQEKARWRQRQAANRKQAAA